MNRTLLPLLSVSLLLAAPAARAGKPELSKKQKTEIRRDAQSLMGWQFRLYQGRNPRLRTSFSPLPGKKVAVEADLVARWRNERGVQASQFGVVKLLPGGNWIWSAAKGNDLYPPRDPAANVAHRQARVDNAVVLQRAHGKASVLYSATDRGNELRIATVDTKTRRLLGLSKNLAAAPMKVAVQAHIKRGANRPNNVVLGPLSKNGRSVEVRIYWPLNVGLSTDFVTHYQVGLDAKGQPTGTVRETEQRYVR